MQLLQERTLQTTHGEIPVEIYSKHKRSSSAIFRRGTLRIYLASHLRKHEIESTIDHFLQWGKHNLPSQNTRIPLETLLCDQTHFTTIDGKVRTIQWKWTSAKTPKVLLTEDHLSISVPFKPNLIGESPLYPDPSRWDSSTKEPLFRQALKVLAHHYLPLIKHSIESKHALFFPDRPLGAITLEFQRTRWGTCNHRGDIMINSSLLLMHPNLIDYVIAHELSHLRHMDHSPTFWKTVKSIYPSYQKAKRSLGHYE